MPVIHASVSRFPGAHGLINLCYKFLFCKKTNFLYWVESKSTIIEKNIYFRHSKTKPCITEQCLWSMQVYHAFLAHMVCQQVIFPIDLIMLKGTVSDEKNLQITLEIQKNSFQSQHVWYFSRISQNFDRKMALQ